MRSVSLYVAKMLIFIILFTHCQSQPKKRHYTDLTYGKTRQQVLDISTPFNINTNTPVVILVHGGGWMSGDKADFNFMRDHLLQLNIAVVNINYRLANENINYKDMVEDVATAISYISKHADNWNIRNKNFIIWGNSAGGHLALLYAYNQNNNGLVNAAIAFGAPTHLTDTASLKLAKPGDLATLLPLITGKPFHPSSLDSSYVKASPFFGNRFIPTLLIHGLKDDIVPSMQSVLLHNKLKQQHVNTIFLPLRNGGHGGENAIKEDLEKMNFTIKEWIKTYGF